MASTGAVGAAGPPILGIGGRAPGVRADRMLLSYRAFGLALTQVVRLQRATVLTCGRPGG